MKPTYLLSLFAALALVARAAYFPYHPVTKDVQDNVNVPAGKTLSVAGTLSGTPAGGTFNLSNLTLTLPASTLALFQTADADLASWALLTRAAGFDTFAVTPSGANLASLLTTALPASKGGTGLTALSGNVVSLLGAADYAAIRTQLTLGNVDNTSDANKPISSATQAALDAKETPAGAQTKADAAQVAAATDATTKANAAQAFAAQRDNHVGAQAIATITGLQAALDSAASAALSTNAQTGTNYTLTVSDRGKIVTMSNASANTVTVPLNSTAAIEVGTRIYPQQLNVGATSIVAEGGVTLTNVSGTAVIGAAGHYAGLLKTGTNAWEVAVSMLDRTTTTAPTTGDDTGDGYQVGSIWRNTSTGLIYYCADNTAASAVWVPLNTAAVTGMLKDTGTGVPVAATEGTDYLGASRIDNTAYNASSWNGVTDRAPTMDSIRDKLESYGGGWVTSLLFTSTASSKQIDNSTTETTIFSGTIPGGTLGTSGVVECHLHGLIKNNTGGATTFIIRVKYGATTIYQDTSQSIASAVFDRPWNMNLLLFADNSASAQRLSGWFSLGSANAVTSGYGDFAVASILQSLPFGGTAAETSSGDLTVSVTIELSTANADYEWTTHKASAWRK